MPKYKVCMDGFDAWFVTADHVAYEGRAIIFYNDTPYQPKVIINRDAYMVVVNDND